MRKHQIIREFDFYAEILPITLVGILLNVAGRQIASYIGNPIFADMVGTAFSAILLGPWWAAAVASATTVVNGSFSEIYFPFGVVNVAGALFWGYLSRAADLRHRTLAPHKRNLSQIIFWTIILALGGGLLTGLTSTAVKLIIFPPMGRPLVVGEFFTRIESTLQSILGANVPPALTLATGDLLRDFTDKAVVIPVAVFLVGFSRAAMTLGEGSLGGSVGERLRTDAASIFVFACFYSAFIFLAQLLQPILHYPGAERPMAWLSEPSVALMLYAPLILAIFAFIFATLLATDRAACRLHALRGFRSYVYRNVGGTNSRIGSLVRAQGVQPLSLGVTLWSLRGVVGERFGVPIALLVIVVALIIYFIVARMVMTRLSKALSQTRTLHRWLEIDNNEGSAKNVLSLFRNLFSSHFSQPIADVAKRDKLIYSLGFVNSAPRSRLEDLLAIRRDDLFNERIAIVGVVDGQGVFTHELGQSLDMLVAETGAKFASVLSSTPVILDREVIHTLQVIRQRGPELLLFDWTDVSIAIAACTFGGQPQASVQRARIRFLSALNYGDLRIQGADMSRPAWLASRSLPCLKFIIERMPRRSKVIDLGCGYGRHTFAALESGHGVVAVDRNPDVCRTLQEDVAQLGLDSHRITALHADYIDVSPEITGYGDLVAVTGVLQHARDGDEMRRRLTHIAGFAGHPSSVIYIEMLFDMLFDGAPSTDGRMRITQEEFEGMLQEVFPSGFWRIERTRGAQRNRQSFTNGSRSFSAPAQHIESTAVEYAVRRSFSP